MLRRFIILLSLFLLISFRAFAQFLNADFNTPVTKGCSPLTVFFENTSSPSSGLTYYWDFGNGSTSVSPAPIIIFTEPGTFDITLIISDGLTSDTLVKKNYITVFQRPLPDFMSDQDHIGCVPYTVDFKDKTTAGDTSITIWHWDFGDGHISSLQNPAHQFSFQDSFTISLYVKDRNNCDNFIVKENLISVFKPLATFGCTDSVSCNGFLETYFINQSSGNGNLSYTWDFGDGTLSIEKNPIKDYTEPGFYHVQLITTDEKNCSDTMLRKNLIAVEELKAEFQVNKDTFCINENLIFTNTSSIKNKSRWEFGDGSISDAINPTHRYSLPGNYQIRLTITIDKGCSDTFIHTINVENVIADYQSSQSFGCESEVSVNYSDKSFNAIIWDWRFGNKEKSSLQNPTINYTNAGIYIDTLIVTSRHGCKSMKIVNPGLTIVRPRAIFTPNDWVEVNSIKGCSPLTVNFKDKSVYATTLDTIKNWFWDFGDGTTSSSINPSHVFQGSSIYPVSLKITTAKGCISYYSASAKTGTRQNTDFSKDGPDIICASDPVQFTDKSENKNLINEWYWKFGDGTASTKQNPLHVFADTGYMEVKLTVYYNGCPDDEIKSKFVYVKGPISKPDYTTNCTNPLNASLKANPIAADKLYWDFGDGSPIDSLQQNPNHLYSSRGDYKLKLRAKNIATGCNYEAEKNVVIRQIKAVIQSDNIIGCPGTIVSFNPEGSLDEYNYQYNQTTAKYLWDFDDGTIVFNSELPFKHPFNSKGTYQVKLKVKDFRGCEDSVIQQIKIYKPEPDFRVDHMIGCMPMSVSFENRTISDTAIVQWLWEFGDNTSSTEINPVHIYDNHSLYHVSLTATDKLGCSTKLSRANYIEALKPYPDFVASDQTICIGDTISFTSLSTDSIKSYFSGILGDGTNSNESKPNHSYSNTGSYHVTLRLIDVQGCDSAKTVTRFIDIQEPPWIDFEVDQTFANCFPVVVSFTDKSEGININQWNWSFGENQSSAQIQNPVHTYTKPGSYHVSLNATTSYGCSNSMTRDNLIEIKGPWAKINAPDTICKNSPFRMIAEDQINVHSLQWFFNDGTVGFGDSVTHSYHNAGLKTPVLLLMSDDEHTCDKYFVDTLLLQELVASIHEYENGQTGCVPFTKNFSNQSIGADSWFWDFGDGTTSINQNPLHLYNQDGQFNVRLISSTNFGCKDTVFSYLTVFPLPVIKLTGDTLICKGQSIQLQAEGAKTYTWFPGQDLDNDGIHNPIATPGKTTNFEVMGVDENACVNYSNLYLQVQQIPVIEIGDTTIIIGEVVKLDAYARDLKSYHWSPSYALTGTSEAVVYAQPLESTIYEITVVDTNQCFTVTKSIAITIRKEYTIDVPKAFSPNGDGVNDKIFVNGWGIKEVLDFKIYNRFGELVFEGNDKNEGWDGFHRGNSQNIEAFTYYAKVITYENEILEKTGTIKLLK